mmetsp:Transcript_6891/g.10519  ORF Transcript_6891/g.10519 Transcript_6891/m.10519 type:complete len:334 (-) Transcript_6891:79-1080(-)
MEDWGSEIIPKVMRVNQLDAQTLDEDLHQLLWVGLKRIARHGGQEFLGAFGFEIRALLKLLVFVNTTGVNKPTPGLELQNLRLVGTGIHKSISKMGLAARLLSRRERVFYGGMTIVAPWILERLKSHMTDWEWINSPEGSLRRYGYHSVYILEQLWTLLSTIQFFHFLAGGAHRSLVERLLRIRVMYSNPRAHRALSFEFMNQYLVWRTVARFLLFAIPLVDIRSIIRSIRNAIGLKTSKFVAQKDSKGQLVCGICGISPITIPVSAKPCGHVFCYSCIRTQRMIHRNYRCPISGCGEVITGEIRVTFDSKSSDRKNREESLSSSRRSDEKKK